MMMINVVRNCVQYVYKNNSTLYKCLILNYHKIKAYSFDMKAVDLKLVGLLVGQLSKAVR